MSREASKVESIASNVRLPDGDFDLAQDEICNPRKNIGNYMIGVLLEILRDREGAPVNYRELMNRIGRTVPQVRADPSMLSRVPHGITDRESWLIESVYPTDDDSNIAYTAPKI